MKKTTLSFVLFFVFQTLTFGQQKVMVNEEKNVLFYHDGYWPYADSLPLYNIKPTIITNLEIPKTDSNDKIITHLGYSLLYNERHEQSIWVAYILTKEETTKLFERTNKFIPDPEVKSGTATGKDYEGSNYDRGHLAPASDMGSSHTTMTESFYYSNISPQTPGFNRGVWKRLEELVRTWAVENDTIYIVTGPILTEELQTIGSNKVSVPSYFYKVILDYSAPNVKGIGFIIPNVGSKENLQYYSVSIDSIEALTGIDFFYLLPDEEEALVEKTICIKCWTWVSVKIANENSKSTDSISVLSKGAKKADGRCKNKTLNKGGKHNHRESHGLNKSCLWRW